MKKIKKIIVAGVVLVVVLVVVAVVFIDRIAKAGTEKGATYALGTKTTLKDADIGLVAGCSELDNLQVNNPPGFDTSHFLKLNKGVIAVSLGSLTGDTVEVPEFTLEGIDVNLEKKGASSNYQVILDNLKRFESKSEPQPKQEKEEGKRFVIREILIKPVTAHVKLSPLPEVTVTVPEIRLKNVGTGSDKGVMVSELTDALLKAIMMAIAEQGGSLMPKEILGELDASLKSLASLKDVGATLAVGVGGAMKELGGQASQTVQQATEQASKTVEQAKEQASKSVQEATGQASKTVQATTQEAAKTVQDTAGKAAKEATGVLGGLLKKPEENKPK
jgi:vacuolar-type H+-ATPase subunit H